MQPFDRGKLLLDTDTTVKRCLENQSEARSKYYLLDLVANSLSCNCVKGVLWTTFVLLLLLIDSNGISCDLLSMQPDDSGNLRY